MRREGPGPGKYILPPTLGCSPHDPRKEKRPCFSIGKRLDDRLDSVGPGPGKYAIEHYNRYGRQHISAYMGKKLNTPAGDPIPAPNAYKMPTPNVNKQRPPAFPLGAKLHMHHDSGIPGPNIYKLPMVIGPNTGRVTFTPKAPVFSIAKRLPTNYDMGVPGPKYLPKFDDQGRLKPTLKFRPRDRLGNDVPGPKYNLQNFQPGKKTPAFSLGIRYPEWVQPHIVEDDN